MQRALRVLTETWWSESVGREKSITVVLPAGYSPARRPYGVLYLLHGFGGNRRTWLQRPDLATQLAAGDLVVVLPESGRSWLINDARGRRYEDYLLREVVPFVDDRFNTAARRSGRAIAGFSMGGACAFFLTMRHTDVFSVAASNSGAFEAPLRAGDPYHRYRSDPGLLMPTVAEHDRVWGPVGSEVRRRYDPARLVSEWGPAPPVRLSFDVGLGDYARMIEMNRNMHGALTAHGIPHEYRERPGGHDWAFVDAGLPQLFAFVRTHLAVS